MACTSPRSVVINRLASESASKTGIPNTLKIWQTTLFLLPIPPVTPIFSIFSPPDKEINVLRLNFYQFAKVGNLCNNHWQAFYLFGGPLFHIDYRLKSASRHFSVIP